MSLFSDVPSFIDYTTDSAFSLFDRMFIFLPQSGVCRFQIQVGSLFDAPTMAFWGLIQHLVDLKWLCGILSFSSQSSIVIFPTLFFIILTSYFLLYSSQTPHSVIFLPWVAHQTCIWWTSVKATKKKKSKYF